MNAITYLNTPPQVQSQSLFLTLPFSRAMYVARILDV